MIGRFFRKNKIKSLLDKKEWTSEEIFFLQEWRDSKERSSLHLALHRGDSSLFDSLVEMDVEDCRNVFGLLASEEKDYLFPCSIKSQKIFFQDEESLCKEISLDELEKKMEIEFLPTLACSRWEDLETIAQLSKKANESYAIEDKQRWLGTYYEHEIQKGHIPDSAIRWIDPIRGYGLFAKKDLPSQYFIGEYTGVLRRKKWSLDRDNAYCFAYLIGDKESCYVIDALDGGNHTRWINHSDTPNLTPVAVFSRSIVHIIFLTSRSILANEELSYDYGPTYWKKREKPL